MKTENTGKNSPGPIYEFQDRIKYNEVSSIDSRQNSVINSRDSPQKLTNIVNVETKLLFWNC